MIMVIIRIALYALSDSLVVRTKQNQKMCVLYHSFVSNIFTFSEQVFNKILDFCNRS